MRRLLSRCRTRQIYDIKEFSNVVGAMVPLADSLDDTNSSFHVYAWLISLCQGQYNRIDRVARG